MLKIVSLRIVAYQHTEQLTVQILRRFQTINKYLVPFTYILRFLLNVTDTIIVVPRYSDSEIPKCFV